MCYALDIESSLLVYHVYKDDKKYVNQAMHLVHNM